MGHDYGANKITKLGQPPHPLFRFGRLPRPDADILTRSQGTLEGIVTDGQWEGCRSALIEARPRRIALGLVR
jgi:hypothetical protein